jgi:hypothetical protein
MALTLNQHIEIVRIKLAYPANIKQEALELHIAEAVDRYSVERPDELVVDTVGDGGFDYAMPAGFVEGFSSIRSIEYPYVATTQVPPYMKSGKDYRPYRGDSALRLRFLNHSPSTSETFRTTFTAPHSVTEEATTVPAVDERAVSNLAAALLAEQLAAEYENKARSTMPDVTLDLRSKAQEYQTQADRYYRLWQKHMGLPEDGSPSGAVGWMDLDWAPQSGYPPLTHPVSRQ